MTSTLRSVAFFLVLTLFTNTIGFSQSKEIALKEKKLANLYSKLVSFIQKNYDSINFYSEKFESEFIDLVTTKPATLNYSFKKLTDSNFCLIRTSVDGNLRIYSWDAWTGGTMHEYRQIYQWEANGKVYTKIPIPDKEDPGRFCSKIFTVDINKRPYYLAVTGATYSSKDESHSISALTIDGNKLIDTVRLFRTKTQKLNTIDVAFDFFSVVDRPERPLELITYDEKQKIVYIPVVNDKGQVTKKNILYQLKGSYFEFIGIK